MIGDFLTQMISPALIVWLGLTLTPLIVTRLFLQASAARERVLNTRAAQSHLSILASAILVIIFIFY